MKLQITMNSALALLLIILVVGAEEDESTRKSYVCPPNFVRLSYRCYFFSRDEATWQEAYWQCRDRRSNIAIIKNANQDKRIRRMLSKDKLAPSERWIGGVYDWGQKSWKWAASGNNLTYSGFLSKPEVSSETLKWHCLIMDPKIQFRWSTRFCTEKKPFICHTKLKTVSSKDKKRLLRQYGANKYHHLNEIPVPDIPNANHTVPQDYKSDLRRQSKFAYQRKWRKKKSRKYPKKFKHERNRFKNSTILMDKWNHHVKMKKPRTPNRNNVLDSELDKIKFSTYYKQNKHPLHPKPIVEEYSYVKVPPKRVDESLYPKPIVEDYRYKQAR